MTNSNVQKAEGKLGVLVVGLGAVSTTFMTGVLMAVSYTHLTLPTTCQV